MPGIFHTPLNRRKFISTSSSGAALIATVGCSTTRQVATPAGNGQFHLALLSDTHIPGDKKHGHRGFNPWENLGRIIPEVQAAKPEGVIINGDAARLNGQPSDYAELRKLLEPVAAETPVYIGLGNHDDRGNFNQAFKPSERLKAAVPNKHILALDHPAVRVVILDSLLYVDKVPGLLGKEQRKWLAEYLATNSEKPVVLFVHHTLEDGDGDLLDAGQFFQILRPHRHVKAVFYGHSHVWNIGERQGIKMINLPAVGYNFRDSDPVGWVDARFDSSGVDLTLRAFAGNQADNRRIQRVNWNV